MLFNQPLGASDPAVHHMMVGASNPGVLAPGALPALFSENGLFAGVAEGLSAPLPLPNAEDVLGNQTLQGVQTTFQSMLIDPSIAHAVIQSHEPFVQAGMFHQGVTSSIDAFNSAINGHNIASQAIQDGNFIEMSSGGMLVSTDSLLTTA